MQQEIINAFNTRAAIKVFDQSKPLEEDKLNTILESARMAATAYGLQPFRLIEVDTKDLREKIKEAGFGQAQITEAPKLFVIAACTNVDEAFIDKFVELTANTRGVTTADLKGYRDMMVGDIAGRTADEKIKWAGRQAYIALGSMLETAALLGVDAGPMEGFIPQKVDEILGLSDLNLTSLGLVVFGHRGEDVYSKMKKVRISKEDFIIKK